MSEVPASLPIEYFKAALAKVLVESSIGRDETSGRTIKGISVQPRTTESQPFDFNSLITFEK